eukprot:1960591-Alexandrium_andersonii.AAC.1
MKRASLLKATAILAPRRKTHARTWNPHMARDSPRLVLADRPKQMPLECDTEAAHWRSLCPGSAQQPNKL